MGVTDYERGRYNEMDHCEFVKGCKHLHMVE